MTTGVLIYCFDTPEFAYHRLANRCIALVSKNLGLPTTVVTDQTTYDKWIDRPDADYIKISPDTTNTKLSKPWYNTERHMAYEHSPYDTTIVIDADYFCFSDKLLRLSRTVHDVLVHKSSHDVTGFDSMDNDRNSTIDMVWATVIIFKKTDKAKAVFEMVKLVKKDYQHFCNLYRVRYKNFRNDFAFAIALNQINGFGDFDVIPDSIPAVLDNAKVVKIKENTVTLQHDQKIFTVEDSDLHFINKEGIDV